jgi:hypothetical protein
VTSFFPPDASTPLVSANLAKKPCTFQGGLIPLDFECGSTRPDMTAAYLHLAPNTTPVHSVSATRLSPASVLAPETPAQLWADLHAKPTSGLTVNESTSVLQDSLIQ